MMAPWRSFWVVGRNFETPVQGDLAEESVLISELRLWSTLKYRNMQKRKKKPNVQKNWIASSFLSCDFDLALQCARCEIQFAICSLCSSLSRDFDPPARLRHALAVWHRLHLWFHHWPSCIKWTCKSVSNESVLLYLVIPVIFFAAFEFPYTPGRPAADGPWWASASDQPEQR